MATVWKIYALIDPRTGEPRYVGQTCRKLSARFNAHMHTPSNTHKECWIKQLRAENLKPSIVSLYTCYNLETANSAEIFYIADFRARGFRLTNHVAGGGGMLACDDITRAKMRAAKLGGKLTEEHKKKIGDTQRGRPGTPHTPESKKKLSLVQVGKKLSEEHKKKISVALAGRVGKQHSAEAIQKMRLARLGKKQSPETVAKRSAALMGRKAGPRSNETKAKLRAALLGKKHSAETRAKMSASRRGRRLSPEAVAKIAASNRGQKRSPEVLSRMRLRRAATLAAKRELKQREAALENNKCP